MLSRFSCVQLFATPWTVVHQAPLPMGFSRQEYWSRLPCPSPSPGDLPDPGLTRPPKISTLAALSGLMLGQYLPSVPHPPHQTFWNTHSLSFSSRAGLMLFSLPSIPFYHFFPNFDETCLSVIFLRGYVLTSPRFGQVINFYDPREF